MSAKVFIYHDRAVLVADEQVLDMEGYDGAGRVDKAVNNLVELCEELGKGKPVVTDNRQPAAARRVMLRRKLRRMGFLDGIDDLGEDQLNEKLRAIGN